MRSRQRIGSAGKIVVHTTNDFSFNGTGHTLSTLELVLGQAKAGHRVSVVCRESDASMRSLLSEHGVKLVEVGSWKKLLFSWKHSRAFRGAIKTAEVIHLHTGKSMILASLLTPFRCLRLSVATIHNPHQRSTRLLYLARQVVALSPVQAESIRRQTLGIVKATSIPNGTLRGLRTPYPFIMDPSTSPVLRKNSVVFVGGLYPRKGLDVLLKAISKVLRLGIDVNLYVIGNRDNPKVEMLADELGITDHVSFLGFKSHPIEFMAAADLFVLPSREEGFGNVLIEARAAGVPIIASDVGGIPSALSEGAAGILVPPEDVHRLAMEIARLLTDSEWAKVLRGRTSIGIEQFFVNQFVRSYDTVYQKVSA